MLLVILVNVLNVNCFPILLFSLDVSGENDPVLIYFAEICFIVALTSVLDFLISFFFLFSCHRLNPLDRYTII